MIEDLEAEKTDVKALFCSEEGAYVPDTSAIHGEYLRKIRMNIHFMNSSDWKSNYSGEAGKKYAKELIYYANRKLVFNKKMNLPEGNETAVYDPLYQYVLEEDGIYFHADDDLFYYVNEGKRNNYKREVINKYAMDSDSVLNVFYMVHHPDSVRSKTYSASGSGIAIGKALKMGTIYNPEDKPWLHASLLNHEVGHVMGLNHTWNLNDGCDDTPKNRNCWVSTKTGRCEGVTSNNMMDYNSNQHAITPCQIGRMRKNMARLGSKQRDLLVKTWCESDPKKDLVIENSVHFKGAKDVEGSIIIPNGGELRISCRLSMPSNSQIIVDPGGVLILDNAHLHNDCGLKWSGILVKSNHTGEGKVYKTGMIKIEDTSSELRL